MKKIISLIISAILILGVMPAAYAEVTNDINYAKELAALSKASIIDDVSSGFSANAIVTRAEFADYIARLLKIEGDAGVIFLDVPADNLYVKSINALAQQGIISIPDDRKFNPDDAIKYTEAIKITVGAAGYTAIAEANGGYPSGYSKIAGRLKIDFKPEDENSLTQGEAVKLLFEAATVGIYDPYKYSDKKEYTFEVSDETLLSAYHNIYMQRGVVYAVNGASATRTHNADANEINVDGNIYSINPEIDGNEFLGSYIDFLYVYDESSAKGEIIYIEKEYEEDEVVIDSDLYIGFDSTEHQLTYYADEESGKTVSKYINPGSYVVYNGGAEGTKLSELLDNFKTAGKHGSICLKDVNSDGKYEFVVIECYETVVVANYSNGKIYNKLNSANTVDENEYENVNIVTPDGDAGKLHASVPYVVDIAASNNKNVLKIVICSDQIKGVVDSCYAEGGYVVVDGTRYKVDKNYMAKEAASIKLGTEYTLYTNSTGKIVYMKQGVEADELRPGYLLKAAYEKEALSAKLKLRIFDHSANAFNTFTIDDKVKIDGVSYKSDGGLMKIMNALPGTSGVAEPGNDNSSLNNPKIAHQVIMFKSDENGMITEIDTTNQTENESIETGLYKLRQMSGNSHWYGNLARYDLSIVYKSGVTKVMCIPELDKDGNMVSEGSSDTEEYFTTTVPAGITSDMMTITGYKLGYRNPYTDIVVITDAGSAGRSRFAMMVEGFGEGLTPDGDVGRTISVNDRGNKQTYVLAETAVISDGLTEGDLIVVETDTDGLITGISQMYDRETNAYVGDSIHESASEYKGYIYNLGYKGSWAYRETDLSQLSRGYVYDKNGSVIQWTYEKGDASYSGAGYEMLDTAGVPVVIYDSGAREGMRISNGSVADLVDYRSAGDNCSYMIFASYEGQKGAIYIYK